MSLELICEAREGRGTGPARATRRAGRVPAVCYGASSEPVHLSVDPKEFTKALQTKKGRNAVLELKLGAVTHHVMVHDVQRDPVKRTPIHVDFKLVKDDERVVVQIPVRTTGKSKAEDLGGRPNLVRRLVDVTCQVRDIPDELVHDVSELLMGGIVRASELALPPGCEILFRTDYVVISVQAPRGADETTAEEEETAVEGVAATPAAS